MHGPLVTVVLANSWQYLTFRGPNVQAGDFAKWVRASAPSCHSRFDAVPAARIPAQKNASGAVHFFFPSELVNQRLELCFRFMYGGNRASSAYIRFSHIRTYVLRFDSPMPRGTAVGCSSTVVIRGLGFDLLDEIEESPLTVDSQPGGPLECRWPSVNRVTNVTRWNNTHASCPSPVPAIAALLPLRMDIANLTQSHPTTFQTFRSYDAEANHIGWNQRQGLAVRGGMYNRKQAIHGVGYFEDYGAPRCRFTSTRGAKNAPPAAPPPPPSHIRRHRHYHHRCRHAAAIAAAIAADTAAAFRVSPPPPLPPRCSRCCDC